MPRRDDGIRGEYTPWKVPSLLIPRWLACRSNSEVSLGAKVIYATLCLYGAERGFCYPSQKRLAGLVGMSVRQVKRYIKELTSLSLVRPVKVSSRRYHGYEFLIHPWQPLRVCTTNDDLSNTTGTDMAPCEASEVEQEEGTTGTNPALARGQIRYPIEEERGEEKEKYQKKGIGILENVEEPDENTLEHFEAYLRDHPRGGFVESFYRTHGVNHIAVMGIWHQFQDEHRANV